MKKEEKEEKKKQKKEEEKDFRTKGEKKGNVHVLSGIKTNGMLNAWQPIRQQ